MLTKPPHVLICLISLFPLSRGITPSTAKHFKLRKTSKLRGRGFHFIEVNFQQLFRLIVQYDPLLWPSQRWSTLKVNIPVDVLQALQRHTLQSYIEITTEVCTTTTHSRKKASDWWTWRWRIFRWQPCARRRFHGLIDCYRMHGTCVLSCMKHYYITTKTPLYSAINIQSYSHFPNYIASSPVIAYVPQRCLIHYTDNMISWPTIKVQSKNEASNTL